MWNKSIRKPGVLPRFQFSYVFSFLTGIPDQALPAEISGIRFR